MTVTVTVHMSPSGSPISSAPLDNNFRDRFCCRIVPYSYRSFVVIQCPIPVQGSFLHMVATLRHITTSQIFAECCTGRRAWAAWGRGMGNIYTM